VTKKAKVQNSTEPSPVCDVKGQDLINSACKLKEKDQLAKEESEGCIL
jgi:hypothetical protein